jgi:hypothetical protein
MTTGDTV